jgi:hypothetical protein
MCDYSLCGLPTRLAVDGEELVVHRFRTGSMGLASPADLRPAKQTASPALRKSLWGFVKSIFEEPQDSPAAVAVCVPPGAQLILKNIPEDLQRRWDVEKEEAVFFLQTSADANNYRDAVRFRNGLQILLQGLREGIPVYVLSSGNASAGNERDFAVPAL